MFALSNFKTLNSPRRKFDKKKKRFSQVHHRYLYLQNETRFSFFEPRSR